MKELIETTLEEARQTLESFLEETTTVGIISQAASTCAEALKAGNKIISCGNGGSLCDATHFAEELTGRYRNNRIPLPAIAINDPASLARSRRRREASRPSFIRRIMSNACPSPTIFFVF